MASENGGFDAGEMYDEGVEQAGLEQEEAVTDSPDADDSANVVSQVDETAETGRAAETKPAEKQSPSEEEVKAAIEETKRSEEDAESVIESLIPRQQATETQQAADHLRQGKYVPVEDHIKLRARAQAAEHRADELQNRLETSTTQTGGEKPGEAEKSPLEKFVKENPDEDILPPKVQLEERRFQDDRRQKAQAAKEQAEQAEREKQQEQNRQSEALKSFSTRALSSEAEVRKANPDYDAVIKPIVNAKLLSDAEKIEFYKDPNPAQKLYDICKAKGEALRGVLGKSNTPQKPPAEEATKQAPTPNEKKAAEESDMTDEEIFNEISDEIFIKPEE